MLHFIRLFQSIKVTADLLYAASGRSNDAIKILKVVDEETFSRLSIFFIAAIGHGLSATGLAEGVTDIETKSLQKLKRGNRDLRIDEVDITRYEETDLHVLRKRPLNCCFCLRDH